MIKKVTAMLLALLMLTVSAFAVAEEPAETEVITYNEAAIENIDGEFADLLAIEIPFEYFVPASLLPQDVPQEYLDQGLIGIYQTEDKTCSMTVTLGNVPNIEYAPASSLKEVGELYATFQYNSKLVVVNDCDALLYYNEAQNVQGIAFMMEDKRVLSFDFAPASNQEYSDLSEVIISTMGFFDPEAAE